MPPHTPSTILRPCRTEAGAAIGRPPPPAPGRRTRRDVQGPGPAAARRRVGGLRAGSARSGRPTPGRLSGLRLRPGSASGSGPGLARQAGSDPDRDGHVAARRLRPAGSPGRRPRQVRARRADGSLRLGAASGPGRRPRSVGSGLGLEYARPRRPPRPAAVARIRPAASSLDLGSGAVGSPPTSGSGVARIVAAALVDRPAPPASRPPRRPAPGRPDPPPPAGPPTAARRRPRHRFAVRFRVGPDVGDLAGGDLLQGDRQRLAGHRGHLRRHDGAQAFAQLVEVGVDLPAPHGGQAHQGELRIDPIEQILDGWLHHGGVAVRHREGLLRWGAVGGRGGSGLAGAGPGRASIGGTLRPSIPATSLAARSTSSLTTT